MNPNQLHVLFRYFASSSIFLVSVFCLFPPSPLWLYYFQKLINSNSIMLTRRCFLRLKKNGDRWTRLFDIDSHLFFLFVYYIILRVI